MNTDNSLEYAFGLSDGQQGRVRPHDHLLLPKSYEAGHRAGVTLAAQRQTAAQRRRAA